MKRCPKGTRKDKTGKCVPKVTSINSFNACEEGKEWYIDKCYKTCKTTQHRNPDTRRCRKICAPNEIRNPKTRKCTKINLPEKKDNKYELILKRFVNKIKKDIKDQPNVPGVVRKHRKLEISYLKSMCGDVGICLSLNNNYNKIMKMFNNFTDFQYLVGSPREISSGANGSIRISKFVKTVDNVSFYSYVTLKVPKSIVSDNLAYEYFVGHLFVNYFCKYFPVFVQTYGLYRINKDIRMRFNHPAIATVNILKKRLEEGMTLIDPLNNEADLMSVCSSSNFLCLSGQFYNNYTTFRSYVETKTDKDYSDVPFILFQLYYTLHHVRMFFTHYDLHYENIGLVKLPDGYHVDYEYNVVYNGQPAVINFKSKYIVKIIDYGRCYFTSQTPPYHTSKELIKNIIQKNNLCFNKLEFTNTNIDSRVKNESSDLRFLHMIHNTLSQIFKNYPILKNTISKMLFKGPYSTPENLTHLGDGIIRNVTDAYTYLADYLITNTDNSNGLNDASYVGSNSLGTLKVYDITKAMEFIPSVRRKNKGEKSRFEMPELLNVSL